MPVTIAAVLEGRMGWAVADNPGAPAAAFVHLGAFVVFGGDPAAPSVANLLRAAPAVQLVGEHPAWHARIGAALPPEYTRHTRWHFSPDPLDPGHLRTLRIPADAGVRIAPLIPALLPAYRASGLAAQFEENFGDLDCFLREGFAVLALRGDRVVGHAGTYAVCSFGMEVQIEVLPDERGRGTATALAAELLLRALDRGWEPHWDAENPISSRLAQRLGYRLERAYTVYFPGTP
jgi:GNAT superfamily N-acetyltransferase